MRAAFCSLFLGCLLTVGGCTTLKPAQNPLWNLNDAHALGSTSVAFSPDASRLASGGLMGDIKLWKVPEGRLLASHQIQAREAVLGVEWLDDRRILAVMGSGLVVVWDPLRDKLEHTARVPPGPTAMALHRASATLALGYGNGDVNLYRSIDPEAFASTHLEHKVLALALAPDGRHLAVSVDGHGVLLTDLALRKFTPLASADRDALALRFSPDGHRLAAGAWFRLLVWNLETGNLSSFETDQYGALASVDFSPDGAHIATIGRHTDAQIRLMNAGDGAIERRLAPHNLCGYAVRISPDGRYLATASDDASLRLYDITQPYVPTLSRQTSGWQK